MIEVLKYIFKYPTNIMITLFCAIKIAVSTSWEAEVLVLTLILAIVSVGQSYINRRKDNVDNLKTYNSQNKMTNEYTQPKFF